MVGNYAVKETHQNMQIRDLSYVSQSLFLLGCVISLELDVHDSTSVNIISSESMKRE